MAKINYEKRYVQNVELRATADSRKISGMAIVFNSLSENLGGFYEQIDPASITQEFLDSQDVVMCFNHDDDDVPLARSKNGTGTLTMLRTDAGVYFEFEAPLTTLGNDVLESIRRGDVDSCSFSFCVGEDEFEKLGDGTILRTIKSFKAIRDLSIVTFPAYEETNVSARSLESFDKFKDELKKIEESEEIVKEDIRKKQLEIEGKFNDYQERLNRLK